MKEIQINMEMMYKIMEQLDHQSQEFLINHLNHLTQFANEDKNKTLLFGVYMSDQEDYNVLAVKDLPADILENIITIFMMSMTNQFSKDALLAIINRIYSKETNIHTITKDNAIN